MAGIICIDPGITSGIAYKLGTIYQTCVANTNVQVYEFLRDYDFDTVIIEQFNASNISKYGLRTTEIVGGVEAICWLRHLPLIRRTPAQRIPFLRRAAVMLKDKPHMDHQIDALAHLLSWEHKR